MTKTSAPLVVIGAGFAAGKLVTELRELGNDRPVVLLGAEDHPPYERPPLSKAYLQGTATATSTFVQNKDWYAAHNVDLITGADVHEVRLADHCVTTRKGEVPYSQLVFATGSRARPYPLLPTAATSVHQLRTLDDAARLRTVLRHGARILVVGGGWIGLEVAASARTLGAEVTLVEMSRHLLGPILGPPIGGHLRSLHEQHGVDIRMRCGLDELTGSTATLTDGTTLEVDAVVAGIGAIPNDSLAQFAGLEVENGIHVDAGLATSHPEVFAIGDVAAHQHPTLAERVRVEHWQNAVSQAKTLARILTGERIVYNEMPYFFSDQYTSGMEFFGHVGPRGYHSVKIEPGHDGLTVMWGRDGRLVAAAHLDQWDRSEELRRRVTTGH